ncbi:MAG: YggS family pyridoxal phosphate-dependent enzyme [Butyrivibrio sp.]|nr:YggS family pyridoxal phosphate-dependent enzyme [Butyrivibrio sp.]
MSLRDNLADVQRRIGEAALRAGRRPEEITLIAVSKTKPVPMLREIYDAGIRDFGENKVQEITAKSPVLPEDIRWHMIGHLQRNKVKQVIDRACLIHSVDSMRLALQISADAQKKGITVPILLEVNIAGEESKYGFTAKETGRILPNIAALPAIRVKGLMTSAPFVDDPEENRQYFRLMKQLCVDLKAQNIDNTDMDYLSMGMTNDFEVAVEEGATHVRVGTAIFGEREYNI